MCRNDRLLFGAATNSLQQEVEQVQDRKRSRGGAAVNDRIHKFVLKQLLHILTFNACCRIASKLRFAAMASFFLEQLQILERAITLESTI